MGYFIVKNWEPGKTFLHYNGSYHSDNHEGTTWYVRLNGQKLPEFPKVLTISCVEQADVEKLDSANRELADYIIVIPDDMVYRGK
jgi:hypothetical protein